MHVPQTRGFLLGDFNKTLTSSAGMILVTEVVFLWLLSMGELPRKAAAADNTVTRRSHRPAPPSSSQGLTGQEDLMRNSDSEPFPLIRDPMDVSPSVTNIP